MPINIDLHYEAVPAGTGDDAAIGMRGHHVLYPAADSTPLKGWLQHIPLERAIVGHNEGALQGTLAKIAFPYVQCGEDARDMSVGDFGKVAEAAWNRILTTIAIIHGGQGDHAITLGMLHEEVDKRMSQATPEQREALWCSTRQILKQRTPFVQGRHHLRQTQAKKTCASTRSGWMHGKAASSIPSRGSGSYASESSQMTAPDASQLSGVSWQRCRHGHQ